MPSKKTTKSKPKLHNGKPMAHWETEGRKLVIRCLVDLFVKYETHGANLVQDAASRTFKDLANAIDRNMVVECLCEMENVKRGMASAISSFMLTPAERKKKYGK